MERTFEVSGIARRNLILRGILIKAGERFKYKMSEKEYASFRDYINVLGCYDINAQKSAPIEKEQEKKVEVKKENVNSKRNQRKTKKQV